MKKEEVEVEVEAEAEAEVEVVEAEVEVVEAEVEVDFLNYFPKYIEVFTEVEEDFLNYLDLEDAEPARIKKESNKISYRCSNLLRHS
jgi:hypothetical protein